MSGLDALLGGLSKSRADLGTPLWLGTLTAVSGTSVSVQIDGADTAITAIKGAHAASVGDRVILTRIGRSLYVLVNLTTA